MQSPDPAAVCQAFERGGSGHVGKGNSWPGRQRFEGSERAGRAALGFKGDETSMHRAATCLLVSQPNPGLLPGIAFFAEMQIIRKLVPEDQYEPPVEEYVAAAKQRVKEKQTKQRRPFPLL